MPIGHRPDPARSGTTRGRPAGEHRKAFTPACTTCSSGRSAGSVRTWTYHLVADDGSPYREHGIDLWRFRDGKICLKDAYRKTRG
ncbi:hypothetical protein ACFOY2_41470 [Nonomuraea purpurea]|uniref:SnoaL-like domain-containing protein n=1 Tax=Nonomuraea purpurea TaxID=1849276 RepID=A0ABV8GL60_9ACTN